MASKAMKTSIFNWEGLDRKGAKLKGEISGTNPALVKAELRKQGITPKKVVKARTSINLFQKKIKPLDISLFARQMATMLKAGVPLLTAFDIVQEGFDKPLLRSLIESIKQDVAGGTPFAAALAKHPRYFDDLFCSLAAAGEQSGSLDTQLDRIATYKEKGELLKKKVKKALIYPITVILIGVGVSALLLIKVVPKFKALFDSFGKPLPAFTLWVIHLSDLIQKYWWMVLLGIVAFYWLWRKAYRTSKKFRTAVDRYSLRLPILGDILYFSSLARFGRTLSTTFAAGVPLVEGLESVSGATGNVIMKNAVDRIGRDVSNGAQLNFAMRSSGVFTSMMIAMTSIGEESGTLEEMLGKSADYYESEVDIRVDGLTQLMEPFIMVVLGVMVGGLVVAMYLPIFKMGDVVSAG